MYLFLNVELWILRSHFVYTYTNISTPILSVATYQSFQYKIRERPSRPSSPLYIFVYISLSSLYFHSSTPSVQTTSTYLYFCHSLLVKATSFSDQSILHSVSLCSLRLNQNACRALAQCSLASVCVVTAYLLSVAVSKGTPGGYQSVKKLS